MYIVFFHPPNSLPHEKGVVERWQSEVWPVDNEILQNHPNRHNQMNRAKRIKDRSVSDAPVADKSRLNGTRGIEKDQ